MKLMVGTGKRKNAQTSPTLPHLKKILHTGLEEL